jgi:dTDP-glucose 4,6-dehydratase
MNRYLVTGGAGFIGSHFIEYLLKNEPDCQIIILDKLTYAGEKDRLNKFLENSKVVFIEGDILEPKLISDLLNKYNINKIINFAAETHVDRSIQSQREFVETNVLGVQNLLSVSKEVWGKKELKDTSFTQISTDEVYGSTFKDSEKVFDEKCLLNPMNPYAASKASAEFLIKAYINTFNYPANIIRSTNNYGVNQNVEKFIPKIITSYINNQPITIYGDGLNKRCWLYVEDNCRGIYLVVNNKKNQIYNIRGDYVSTNINLVKTIINTLKNDYKIESQSKVIFIDDRRGHDYFYNITDKKIKEELGFNLKTTFKTGIKRVIEYYLDKGRL